MTKIATIDSMDEKNDFELDSDDSQDDVIGDNANNTLDDQPEMNSYSQDFIEEDFVPVDESLDDESLDELDEFDQDKSDLDESDEDEDFSYEDNLEEDEFIPLPLTDDLDIDAALASVADLGDMLAEREAAEIAERESIEAERRAIESEAKRRAEHYFPRPPLVEIERGQMASVVPALLLVALGAWWTFALTTANNPPSTGQITLILMVVFGIISIAYCLFTGRWSSGSLFAGLTALLAIGIIVLLNQGDLDGGYSLLLIAPALGMFFTAILSARSTHQVGFMGVLLLVVAIAAFAVNAGNFNNDNLTDVAGIMLPVVGVALLVLIALPVIFRRQR